MFLHLIEVVEYSFIHWYRDERSIEPLMLLSTSIKKLTFDPNFLMYNQKVKVESFYYVLIIRFMQKLHYMK